MINDVMFEFETHPIQNSSIKYLSITIHNGRQQEDNRSDDAMGLNTMICSLPLQQEWGINNEQLMIMNIL
jgi:hypothetical protein